MGFPRLVIETSADGVTRIRVQRDRPGEGIALLRRVLPLVPELDRISRGNPRPRRKKKAHA